MGPLRFVASAVETDPASTASPLRWFAFRGNQLLVRRNAPGASHPYAIPTVDDLSSLGVRPVRTQPLGTIDGVRCRSAELAPDAINPEGYEFVGLRQLYGAIDPAEYEAAGTGFQVQDWDRGHQFCAACGARTELRAGERARHCRQCHVDYYPRVTPAVIVLLHDGPRVLLVRGERHPPGMYGLVAGFVEAGESFEQCVVREVREETGLELDGLTYFGSQPWPFPHQVMVGYWARAAGGVLRPDPGELLEARWFEHDALPAIPPPLSIARKMIDAWVAGHRP